MGRGVRVRRAVRWGLLFLSVVVAMDALVGDKGWLEMIRARRQNAELSGDRKSVV